MKLTPKTQWAFAFAIPVTVVLLVVHLFGAQLGPIGFLADYLLPGIVSSESYKRAVMHPESNDAYSAYGKLGERRSEAAHDIALEHLSSTDAYLWLNAAHYLGNLGDPASVPYLIKALRHSASRSDAERRQLLVKLTDMDFRTDFTKWQTWWLSRYPDPQVDWESSLGHSPRIWKTIREQFRAGQPTAAEEESNAQRSIELKPLK